MSVKDVADAFCDGWGAINDPIGAGQIKFPCDNNPVEQAIYGDDRNGDECEFESKLGWRRKLQGQEHHVARRQLLAHSFARLWTAEHGSLSVDYSHKEPRNLTLHEAQEVCAKDESCAGYMYDVPFWLRDPDARGMVLLARKAEHKGALGSVPNGDLGWTTHLKQTTTRMLADHFRGERTKPFVALWERFPDQLEEIVRKSVIKFQPLISSADHHDWLTLALNGDEQTTAHFLETLQLLNDTFGQDLHRSPSNSTHRPGRKLAVLAMAKKGVDVACTVYDVGKKCVGAAGVGGFGNFAKGCGLAVGKALIETFLPVSFSDAAFECMVTGASNCPTMPGIPDPYEEMQKNCANHAR